MKHFVIIYDSKTGTTKQAAEWISKGMQTVADTEAHPRRRPGIRPRSGRRADRCTDVFRFAPRHDESMARKPRERARPCRQARRRVRDGAVHPRRRRGDDPRALGVRALLRHGGLLWRRLVRHAVHPLRPCRLERQHRGFPRAVPDVRETVRDVLCASSCINTDKNSRPEAAKMGSDLLFVLSNNEIIFVPMMFFSAGIADNNSCSVHQSQCVS